MNKNVKEGKERKGGREMGKKMKTANIEDKKKLKKK